MKLTLRIIFCLSFLSLSVYPLTAQDGTTAANKATLKKNGNISTKFNKSKNQTTVSLKSMALTERREERPMTGYVQNVQMDMDAFFIYPGEAIEKPVDKVTLRFHTVANNYVMARSQPVNIVLDEEAGSGKMLQLGETDYKSEQKFGNMFEEFLSISIPTDILAKMGDATSVSIYVGSYGYKLKEKQIADIRDFASRAKP